MFATNWFQALVRQLRSRNKAPRRRAVPLHLEAFEDRRVPAVGVTEFPTGLPGPITLNGIAYGSDGNFWVTETTPVKVIRMTPQGVATEFSAGITPNNAGGSSIVAGPNGNLYFTDVNRVDRITTGGSVQEFTSGLSATSGLNRIAAGADNALYIPEQNNNRIARLDANGNITEIVVPNQPSPFAITNGPDNNIYFCDGNLQYIDRLTIGTNAITIFPTGLPASTTGGRITAGPDGAIWATENSNGKIVRMTLDGHFTEFSAGIPAANGPHGIITGPDGNLWFTYTNGIGRMTPTGSVNDGLFTTGITPGNLNALTVGPNGTLWMSEPDNNKVARVTLVDLAAGSPVNVTAGQHFFATLASMTTLDPDVAVTAFGTVIDWGDGSTTISPAGGDVFGSFAAGYTIGDGHTYTQAGPHTIIVTVTLGPTPRGVIAATATATIPVVVAPAAATTLSVSGYPTSTVAGVSHPVTVTARDPFGNVDTSDSGAVAFTSSDAGAVFPTGVSLINGTVTVPAALATVAGGAKSITATQPLNGLTGTQSGITVTPAAATTLSVSGYPATTVAGVAHSFTVTARDPFGNVDTNDSGAVTFTSSDPNPVLPTGVALSNGLGTFSAALKTVAGGPKSITAAQGSVTGAQSGIAVTPAAATSLDVNGFPSSTVAGVAHSFTVTARDPYGNVDTNDSGPVTITSTDPGATLPAGASLSNGTATLNATLATVGGPRSITATQGTVTGSQTGITVTPAPNPVEHFIHAIYLVDLGRDATPPEVQLWSGVYQQGGQAAVVSGVTHSGEALTFLVSGWFQQYLHRPPVPGEPGVWVGLLQGGGSWEQVLGLLLTAPEYYGQSGNSTDAGYIGHLYSDLLHRAASPGEVQLWLGVLGSQGRQGVTQGILGSLEYRDDAVQDEYFRLLHRQPSQAEIDLWAHSTFNLGQIDALLQSSPEFFQNG
jgi:streptogramin lyase